MEFRSITPEDKLVQCLIEGDRNITWVLRAGRGSGGFWESIGFKRSEMAMERVRGSAQGDPSPHDFLDSAGNQT